MATRLRVLASHRLIHALLAVFVIYLIGSAFSDGGVTGFFSAKDNADAADNWPAIVAIGAGGAFGATKFLKNMVDKAVGLPATSFKYMYDIASQPTDEAQADKAIDVYWEMTGIEHAPPGSPGGDIKEAGERFKDFYKGKTDIP
jgi:hypothetical protein